MKVMVIVKASKDSEAGVMPSTELLSEMNSYNEKLVAAGMMLAGEGLHPSSKGYRVRFSGKNRTVIDGPFAETKELIAGFWMWQVKSMEEAVEWVKRCPNPMMEDSEIEIRRVFSAEDFGEAYTPELQQREQAMRSEVEKYTLDPPRFEKLAETTVAGINRTYTFESRVNIPGQWTQFAPYLGKITGQVGNVTYGVCWNYKPGVGFDYLTCVQTSPPGNLPKDFTSLKIGGHHYAVFTHSKPVSAIAETLDAIWQKWLPNSGKKAADAPSFERYDERFDPATMSGSFEIWVPIQN